MVVPTEICSHNCLSENKNKKTKEDCLFVREAAPPSLRKKRLLQ